MSGYEQIGKEIKRAFLPKRAFRNRFPGVGRAGLLRYGIRNLLLSLSPARKKFGSYRDGSFDPDRDKHAVRRKHDVREGWQARKVDGLHYRDYESYEEYLEHQRTKYDEILKREGGFDSATILNYRRKFFMRFSILPRYLPLDARILCAGARAGTEVQVLRDLGFVNAEGIDLNPGPENPYVRKGDFMNLDCEDSSLDLIYSNALDHAFRLEDFFEEHARALKDDGYVLYEITTLLEGKVGAWEAVEWESTDRVAEIMKRYFAEVIEDRVEGKWRWLLLRGKRLPPRPEPEP